MRKFLLSLTFGLLAAHHAQANQCGGENLLEQLPIEDRARLESQAHALPFAQGNFWRATKGDKSLILVGTYHLDDPRHDAVIESLAPHIRAAKTVLVEATATEEAALQSEIARNPGLIVMKDQSLPQLLAPDDWQKLRQALQDRGLPGVMAAKMQPWYVSVLMALPPCLMQDLENLGMQQGLDQKIIDLAEAENIPVLALEPFDTVFKMFSTVSIADQVSMIRTSLAIEHQAEDYLTTLSDAYFAGQSRLIWEFSRETSKALPGYSAAQVDADLAQMERILMTERNQAWIPVIEAAAEQGPSLVAFGALHLAGETGVPRLLELAGWQITALTP